MNFNTTLNDRLAKLDNQFAEMADVLKTKKESFIEMYRKDPRISHVEEVSCLLATNPNNGLDRNVKQEQLMQQQEQQEELQGQLVQLQERLVQQQEIAAETEEMRRQLADQKTQLENMCAELKQKSNEEKAKSQTLLEAIKNLQACQKELEGQFEDEKETRLRLESEKNSFDKKLRDMQQHQIQANDKLANTQREINNLEQQIRKLQYSLSGAQRRSKELQSALDNEARQKSISAKELEEMKKVNSNQEADLLLANDKLTKSQRENIDLKQRINRLQSSLSGAESQNEELQSVVDNLELEKSNLAKELKEMKHRNSKPNIEQLTNELKAVALSETDADGNIRRLRGLLHVTQTRLQDAERFEVEQATKIENSERKHNDAYPKQRGSRTEKVAVGTVETTRIAESKQTVVCDGFSDDNVKITVSSCKRRVEEQYL